MTSREVMVLPSRQCHLGSTSARSILQASFESLPCALNHFSMYSWAMKRTLDRSHGSGRGTRPLGVAASRASKSPGSDGCCPGANASLFAGEAVRSSLFLLLRRSTALRGSIPLSNHSRFFIASWRASAKPTEGNLPRVIRVGVPSHLNLNSHAFDPLIATRKTRPGTPGSEMSQIDAPGFRAHTYECVNFRAWDSVDTLWTLRVQ
jgi:hypothetical protein